MNRVGMLSVFRAVCRRCGHHPSISASAGRNYSIYEPPYLQTGPQVETYPKLNICVQGYDYATVESYSKYVHNLAVDTLDLDAEMFGYPTRDAKVTLYEQNSSKVQQEYRLKLHERVLRVVDMPATTAPVLFEVIQMNLPQGLRFTVKEFTDDEETFRYVPDTILAELRNQADTATQNIKEYRGK